MAVSLTGRHFLKLLDFTPEEIRYLLDLSADLKAKKHAGEPHRYLEGRNVALIFEKTSTRTRCAFEVGAADLGMRRLSCSDTVRDTGRILENIVYLERRRREGAVYVGKLPGSEIDFVTNGPSGRAYYQVAESVADTRTLERELAPLRALRDNHPKYLITLDDVRPVSYEGIRQVYAPDWLLDQ